MKKTIERTSEKQYPRMLYARTYRDEDCPKCSFPETITIRDVKTMKPVAIECSNDCGYLLEL